MTTEKVLSIILWFASLTHGRTLNEIFQLRNGDGSKYTSFAGRYGMAVRGEHIVVGASKDDYKGVADVGSATIFQSVGRDEFVRVKKLYPPDGVKKDHFGSSVAINNKYVVVGAAWQDARKTFRRRGAVYIYDLRGNFEQKLLPLDKYYKKVSMFGWNVAIRDDHTIVVSSPWEDQGSGKFASGGVYVFSLNKLGSWVLTQRLSRPHLVMSHFGYGIRLSGDDLIVNGGNVDNGNNEISVNIYTLNSSGKYELRQQVSDEMTFSNKSHDCKRGGCMDVSGKDMVVLTHPYTVRFYENNGDAWVPRGMLDVAWMVQKFTSSKSIRAYVRLQNGVLLIGVWWETAGKNVDAQTLESGAVYVYKRNSENGKWEETDVLLPKADAKAGDLFGKYVAFDENLVLAKHLFSSSTEGSVYVYDLSEIQPTTPKVTPSPVNTKIKPTNPPTKIVPLPRTSSKAATSADTTTEDAGKNAIPTIAESKPSPKENVVDDQNENEKEVLSSNDATAEARSSEVNIFAEFIVITLMALFSCTLLI